MTLLMTNNFSVSMAFVLPSNLRDFQVKRHYSKDSGKQDIHETFLAIERDERAYRLYGCVMTGTHFGGLPGPGPILASCFVVSCTSTTTRLNLCNVSLCTNAKRFSRKTDLFLCLHPLGQKDRTQIQRFCVCVRV